MARKLLQTKKTTLTYGISDVSTTIQLKNLLKLNGTSVSASDIGDLLYGTFGPGTSKEEIFSINGANVTIETNGNVTITGIVRGLKEVSPYGTGGFATDHGSGEVVIFGNNPQVYQDIYDYINDAIVGGGVDASTTVKGISKLSTAPASPSNPIAVGDNDPRIPTTNYTAAMAGTLGTPSATNKFVTQDNVYTGETDQEQATQNATVEFGMPNTSTNKNKIVQSFIPVKTKIRGVKLYKAANTGTFTGTVTVELFANSGGNPTGSALATKTFTNVEYNTLVVGEFETLFSAEYSMTTGSTYHLVISASTADGSNHPNIGTNSAGGYTNGSVKFWNTTDGYVAVATIDLYFKTLQGTISQVIQSNANGKIPGTFFSYAENPYISQQFLPNLGITSTADYGIGSMNDGSAIFVIQGSTFFARYQRDFLTGMYFQSHSINPTITIPTGDSGSIINIGNYIYVFSNDGTNIICSRFLAADLTGEQQMTMPGAIPCTARVTAWTDGTNVYVVSLTADTVSRKWSISGTTFTAVSTGTVTTGIFAEAGMTTMFDGFNAYVARISTSNVVIEKLTNYDGSSRITTTKDLGDLGSSSTYYAFIINITSDKCYIGTSYDIYDQTAKIANWVYLVPISKP